MWFSRAGAFCPFSGALVEAGCWLKRAHIGTRTARCLIANLEDPSYFPPPRAVPLDAAVWLRPPPQAGDPEHSATSSVWCV